jgi:hypothetical protein
MEARSSYIWLWRKPKNWLSDLASTRNDRNSNSGKFRTEAGTGSLFPESGKISKGETINV